MASENGQEKRETLAEVVAEIRRDIKLGNNYYAANLPDRIEAAWKREKAEADADALAVGGIVEAERHKPGNAAVMRWALVFLRDKELYLLEGNVRHCVGLTVFGLEQACKIMRGIIEDALSEPPRQCDVGTAEEQAERFRNFCKMDYISEDCPDDCPLYRKDCSTIRCPFAWAQTPYEAEEGAGK